jgi:hypothetical protein
VKVPSAAVYGPDVVAYPDQFFDDSTFTLAAFVVVVVATVVEVVVDDVELVVVAGFVVAVVVVGFVVVVVVVGFVVMVVAGFVVVVVGLVVVVVVVGFVVVVVVVVVIAGLVVVVVVGGFVVVVVGFVVVVVGFVVVVGGFVVVVVDGRVVGGADDVGCERAVVDVAELAGVVVLVEVVAVPLVDLGTDVVVVGVVGPAGVRPAISTANCAAVVDAPSRASRSNVTTWVAGARLALMTRRAEKAPLEQSLQSCE